MRAEVALMSGLSFCLGLVIGLVIQLPNVKSPLDRDRRRENGEGYRHVNDVRSRLTLGLKPTYRHHNGKDYHKGPPFTESSLSVQKDTYNKINTGSYESKQVGIYKDNMFSKQIYAENPTVGLQKGIQMEMTAVAKEIEPIPAKVVQHIEQTPSGTDSVIDTSKNKQEIHSQSNKSPEYVTSDEGHNEKRDRTIEADDSRVEGTLSPMQNSPNISHWIKGVYFTQEVDLKSPGFSDLDVTQWRIRANHEKIVDIKEGCGRMQNRKILFSDGTPACARYRINIDQMQGEIYSYYLSLLMGIRNVPPSVVVNINPHGAQWEGVGEHIVRVQWSPDRPLIVTPWVPHLVPSFIPRELRTEPRTLRPGDGLIKGRTLKDIIELAQWSDLLVFDYLTANVDRLVNNLFNLQWNNDMMNNPTHNLGKSSQSSQLVFLDNESGLFHSYRLLDKYSHYHESLLQGLCIFRKTTAQNIKTLHKTVTSAEDLFKLLTQFEPLNSGIPRMPVKNLNILIRRIGAVYRQIIFCERKYGNGT